MSDDAIAVTTLAASPPQPNEAVYQALNAALSATARGRWFLSEFAKRNRNSESSKMLDAVARIEQVVADPSLATVSADLLIVRNWARIAQAEVAALATDPEHDAARAAAARAARIIREIATSMRSVGNDPRICNILDTQLDSIEAAQVLAAAPTQAAASVFDRLIAQIEELVPAPPRPQASPQPQASAAPGDPEARLAAVADLAVACATGASTVTPTAAQLAEDDHLLALIAGEMASPDEFPVDPLPASIAAPPPIAVEAPPLVSTSTEPAAAAPELPPTPAPALSLGQSVLAQGLVEPPAKPARDPFVALKRLTQAEKVALFT